MSRNLVAFGLCALGIIASCQATAPTGSAAPVRAERCDLLSPRGSLITHPQYSFAQHEANVAAVLFSLLREQPLKNGFPEREPLMIMVKERPGVPQEAAYILRSAPGPGPVTYEVVHVRAKQQIVVGGAQVGIDAATSNIDAQTVQALEQAWSLMAREARWPNQEEASRATLTEVAAWDKANTYTFDYLGDAGYGQGMVTVPRPGTCAAALANLGDLLTHYPHADEANRRRIATQLRQQSEALAKRITGPPPQ